MSKPDEAKPADLIESDTLVFPGGAVKALDDGTVEGYLVLFSTAKDPDASRFKNFYTAKTNFGFAGRKSIETPIYYHHGLHKTIGKTVIGRGVLTVDETGVYLKGRLDVEDADVSAFVEEEREKRKRYLKKFVKGIKALVDDGELGWSSGTAVHLVETKGKGYAGEITHWPLGVDATLTPTPAEPRTAAIGLKSLGPAREIEDLFAAHGITLDDDPVDVGTKADASAHSGLLIALYPPADVAAALAIESGESTDSLHVTLCYCGDTAALGEVAVARAVVAMADLARYMPPVVGQFNGTGRFAASPQSDGLDVFYTPLDAPGLSAAREQIARALGWAGCAPRADHGWIPHLTLSYVAPDAASPLDRLAPVPVRFDRLTISYDGRRADIPLAGSPSSVDAYKALGAFGMKGLFADVLAEQNTIDGYYRLTGALSEALRDWTDEVEDGNIDDPAGSLADIGEEFWTAVTALYAPIASASAPAETKSLTAPPLDGRRLDDDTGQALDAVRRVTARWQRIAEKAPLDAAVKIGAKLTRSRRERMKVLAAGLQSHVDALLALLAETEPVAPVGDGKAAKALDVPDLEMLAFRRRLGMAALAAGRPIHGTQEV